MAEVTLPNKSGHKSRKLRTSLMSKKALLAVTEHAPDVICRFDKQFRLLYVNPAIEVATGIPTHAFLNKTTRDLGMPEEHSAGWEEKIAFVVKTGQQTTFEFPFLTPVGLRFFHTILVPERSGNGEVETVLTISRDMTDKEENERKQEETVGFVSHELKTPVTTLKLTTQMLQKKLAKAGNKQMTDDLTRMHKQIDKLTNIISDLMDTTRIEHGSMKLVKESFDFDELVQETVEDVQKVSPDHKIEIKGKAKKAVYADRIRIGQVLTNLLSNAIRYSPDKFRIIVGISSDAQVVTCSVQDFGIGISKEQQEKIFERFYRVKEVVQAVHMGMGLGLYISHEIVNLHQGKLWVESELGTGSTFFFTLPVM